MRVLHVGFYRDDMRRRPDQLLHAWSTFTDVGVAGQEAGFETVILQAAHENSILEHNGVSCHFTRGRRALVAKAMEVRPDVVHVRGFAFPLQTRVLQRALRTTPFVLQYHKDGVPRWRRPLHRYGFANVAGLICTERSLMTPFLGAGVFHAGTPVFEIPGATSRFGPGDRAEARQRTGLYGDPGLLWVGQLSDDKDPLTALAAMRGIMARFPEAHLWMCYTDAPLWTGVQEFLRDDATLTRHVHLVGPVPHEDIQGFYRAADLFVLASRREATCFALVEAMACGLAPVVTDIPAFRALTCDGGVGRLFPCGDATALADAIVHLHGARGAGVTQRVRGHFETNLSARALGLKLRAAYESVLVA